MDETVQTAGHNSLKGQMFRRKRQMPDGEAREFLRGCMIAHVGTVDENGRVISSPIFSTTLESVLRCRKSGRCTRASGSAAIRHWCMAGIVRGPARILYQDREKKSWFLDRLLARRGDPSWVFEPGYPLLDQIILYEQRIEILKSPVLRGAHYGELTLSRSHTRNRQEARTAYS